MICGCGSIKIENRDLGLCATCNRQRRKAPKEVKVYKIPPVSAKKKKREAELTKLRKKKKQEITYCETCGATGVSLSYSHIVKVSGYGRTERAPPQHRHALPGLCQDACTAGSGSRGDLLCR